MKTLPKFLITLLVGLLFIYSCEEDSFTEEDALKALEENALQNDSINNKYVELTIKVINASGDFATKGHAGATVTISLDGESLSDTTNTEGAITFTGLKPGVYAVNIAMAGFTTVDFTTEANVYGNYSVQIPILSTTTNLMTISGKVTLETNLLNAAREAASGVTVIAKPNLPDYFEYIPDVREIAYSGYTNTATTDENGIYSISVPADKAGELSYTISVPVFEKNQTLLLEELNGVDVTGAGNPAQVIATRFGTSLTSLTSPVPAVSPVYCVFSAPEHTFTPAILSVEIDTDNSGSVDKAYVTEAGANYGPYDPYITINNTNANGSDAYAVLITDNNTGQIEYINIVGSGSDFTTIPTVNLAFEQDKADIEVTAVDGTGAITNISVTDGGEYLSNKLSFTGGSGTGAELNIVWNGSTYQIDTDGFGDIIDGGRNYVVGDKLSVSVPTTVASATVTMKTPVVSSVQVINEGQGYEKNASYDVKFSYGNALAKAYTDAYGRVYAVEVTSGGYNYTTAPEAEVIYSFYPKTATAKVVVNNNKITGISNLDGGDGYDNAPTVRFYHQYNNTEIANIYYTASISTVDPFPVTNVYNIRHENMNFSKNITTQSGDGDKSNVKSLPGVTVFADFYLGTGVRTNGN